MKQAGSRRGSQCAMLHCVTQAVADRHRWMDRYWATIRVSLHVKSQYFITVK